MHANVSKVLTLRGSHVERLLAENQRSSKSGPKFVVSGAGDSLKLKSEASNHEEARAFHKPRRLSHQACESDNNCYLLDG